MKWSKVSLCYHPTTIVFIDDQKNFLKELNLRLNQQTFCQFYNNPQEFIHYFNNEYIADPFTNHCISVDTDQVDHIYHDLDLRAIRKEISNRDRFSQTSTIFIDFSMPGMDGLVCAEKIKSDLVSKILLTGRANNDTAVEAFNKHLIHKFIQKNTSDFINLIIQSIQECQLKYFMLLGGMGKHPRL